MSLRRRIRRQNRALLTNAPATRPTRLGLDVLRRRGLRNFHLFRRPATPRTNMVIQREFKPFYMGFNRDVRHLEFIREQRKLMSKEPLIKKPLSTVTLDGTIITDLPRNHPICIARAERRELMFATGKAGKGGQRPRRRLKEILRCD